MRHDGRPFPSGSESPRVFSDILGERPLVEDDVDEAPPAEPRARSPRANVGHAQLKRYARG